MIQSMTGYGVAEKGEFKVEVRSLNHKHLDVSIRMPSLLLKHEIPLRNMVKERFARGRFDAIVSFTGTQHYKVSMNRELAVGIYDAFCDLKETLSVQGDISMDFFSSFRDLLISETSEFDPKVLFDAFDHALAQVAQMRNTEGTSLMVEMHEIIAKLKDLHRGIAGLSGRVGPRHLELFRQKVAVLLSEIPLDEARVAQELALQAQRMDIAEELARLKSHFAQIEDQLSSEGPIGRRLDFIFQELNREVNTIASKVDDIEIISLTIDMKTEIDRLREQAHNIQ